MCAQRFRSLGSFWRSCWSVIRSVVWSWGCWGGVVRRSPMCCGVVWRGWSCCSVVREGGRSRCITRRRWRGAVNRQVGEVVGGLVGVLPEGRRLRVLEWVRGPGGRRGRCWVRCLRGGTSTRTPTSRRGSLRGRSGVSGRGGVGCLPGARHRARPGGSGVRGARLRLVVAANVLHATRDLGEALSHCRALLAPSGVLVCVEGLRAQGWLDLTFGLLEGWWRYGDGYRTDGALVGEGVWRRALGEAGYGEVSVVSCGVDATQGVIVARGPAEVEEPSGLWLLAADRGETGRRLAAGLVERGQRVVVAGEDVAWSDPEALPGVRVAHVEAHRREAWRSLVEGLAGEGVCVEWCIWRGSMVAGGGDLGGVVRGRRARVWECAGAGAGAAGCGCGAGGWGVVGDAWGAGVGSRARRGVVGRGAVGAGPHGGA